jgi:hypothetical protein
MYLPITETGETSHLITNIDVSGYEQYVDIICYASSLASQPYSRKVVRIVYTTNAPSIDANAAPNLIYDWNDRKSILTISTAPETVCAISSTGSQDGINDDAQNFPEPDYTGNYANALTYSTIYKKELSYNAYDTSAKIFNYQITCKTLSANSTDTTLNVTYNISNNLNIDLMSPNVSNSGIVELLIQTNLISSCTMKWNGAYKGGMIANITNMQHYMKINSSTDGLFTAEFNCTTPVTGLRALKDYSILINTSLPAPYCGDGIIQKPSEECDGNNNLDGRSCTSGFTGFNYTGGVLQCGLPGTSNACKYDFSTCDSGNGWCGDGKIEGPDSQNIYEQCDGNTLPSGLSCVDFGFKTGGSLSCNNCVINTSRCIQQNLGVQGVAGAQSCSNHMLESGEQCEADGSYLTMCTYFGYDAGTLTCNNCMYDMSIPLRHNNLTAGLYAAIM